MKKEILPIVLGAVIICGAIGYGVYSQVQLSKENSKLKESLKTFEENLIKVQSENLRLLQDLQVVNGTVDEFAGKVGELTGTVGTLAKLAETDPELLKKYSKISFLNENYVPKGLVDIASNYLLKPTKSLQVLSKVNAYLQQLMEDSLSDGLELKVLSAYRSFGAQSTLKSSYKFTYGAGTANQFSADQGYSEHQLGTTVDFTTPTIGEILSGFSKTPEYKWLTDNAYKYGFVLSYPPNNAYYTYEPWHWRFVGVELATRLHEEKQYFYNLEQRQIDPYLVKIFD
ncbi:MAG: M15 family metallopeptidase [Minisyncoccota bacterium]